MSFQLSSVQLIAMKRTRPRLCSIAVVWILSILVLPAAKAQSPSFDERAAKIERMLDELRREVQELRATTKSADPAKSKTSSASEADLARIRDEGLNRSQLMQTLSYLTDVIGPRLTGSPNLKRANEWTRDRFSSWGLADARLEAWGPFGRGWSLKRFSAQIVEPQSIPLIAAPKAWTPGLDKPVVAEVIYIDAKSEADLEKYKGKLKGAIVLAGAPRPVNINFQPQGRRMTEEDLRILAESKGGRVRPAMAPTEPNARGTPRGDRPSEQPAASPADQPNPQAAASPTPREQADDARPQRPGAGRREPPFTRRLLSFLVKEEAALLITPSPQGDGGTIFVASASVPGVEGRSGGGMRPWSPNPPATVPQIACNVEDYNRMVRVLQHGEKLTMAVELAVQFHDEDQNAYNTIAEIPGGELKDEVVMLGAHLDSWHAGTGATDNGAGSAVVMETVRILKALDLKPRRTIRVALWTGEEQGLLGSKAYVRQHFGHYLEETAAAAASSAQGNGNPEQRATSETAEATSTASGRGVARRTLIQQPAYDKFAAYFNLDNGSGRIRGIYAQENAGAWAVFRGWLAPFRDLDAETVTLATTGGTDHLSFDAIGLPGFQFIQDPIEYMSRTHHSNIDVYDHIEGNDLKQAAVIMTSFVYNAAMADDKLPRKAVEGAVVTSAATANGSTGSSAR